MQIQVLALAIVVKFLAMSVLVYQKIVLAVIKGIIKIQIRNNACRVVHYCIIIQIVLQENAKAVIQHV
jgi:hypothetical protein